MLRRHVVLLIAIRPSDGDVKPGGHRGAFQEEQAMRQHRVSPSPFLSSSHTRPTCNVVCPSGAWIENRPHSTSSICLVRNLNRVIVQLGRHWNRHILQCLLCVKLDINKFALNFKFHGYHTINCDDVRSEFSRFKTTQTNFEYMRSWHAKAICP